MHNPAVKVNHPGVKIARTSYTMSECVKKGCLNKEKNMHFESIMHKVTENL